MQSPSSPAAAAVRLDKAGWWVREQPDGGLLRWHERQNRCPDVQEIPADVRRLASFRPWVAGPPIRGYWSAGVSMDARYDAERDLGDLGGPEIGPEGRPLSTLLDPVQLTICYDSDPDLTRESRESYEKAVRGRLAAELQKRGYLQEKGRLTACTKVLGAKICRKCGAVHVHATHCNLWRLCPTCARSHARKRLHSLVRAAGAIRLRPRYRWRLLTLTIRTEGDYQAALRLCVQSFAWLWKNYLAGGVEPGKRKPWVRCKVPGVAAFRAVEFGPLTGNVHVHVMYFGPWIEQQRHNELGDTWAWLTGGSWIVNVKEVRKQHDLYEGFAECAKYCVKVSAAAPDRAVDFWVAMKGTRMTQAYGALLGIPSDEKLALQPEPCECGGTSFVYLYGFKPERGPPCRTN